MYDFFEEERASRKELEETVNGWLEGKEEKSEWLKNLEEELAEDLEGLDKEEVDKNSSLESLKDMLRMPLDLDGSIRAKTEEVKDAWNNPGRAPGYHRKMQNKLRKEWPVLAAALDRL